jgi:hypothetical protein
VISPVLRPDAEDEPNRLGATLADIRHTIETVTRDRIVSGDQTLALVAGEAIITADHLGDGIHPDDEGHKRIAATVGKALTQAMKAADDDESPTPEVMKEAARTLRGDKPVRTGKAGRSGKAGRGAMTVRDEDVDPEEQLEDEVVDEEVLDRDREFDPEDELEEDEDVASTGRNSRTGVAAATG